LLNTSQVDFRAGRLSDLPVYWNLINDYKHLYEHALGAVNPDTAEALLRAGQVITITCDGFPVGGVCITAVYLGLHATVHSLIKPAYLRKVMEAETIKSILGALFVELDLLKLKAVALEQQAQAIKLLKLYGFRKQGLLKNETFYNSEPASILLYELNRAYFQQKKEG
jgi:RimJ/RimL family protein N-acetyltransferase